MFRQGQLAVHGLAILLGRNEAGISNRGKFFLHHAVQQGLFLLLCPTDRSLPPSTVKPRRRKAGDAEYDQKECPWVVSASCVCCLGGRKRGRLEGSREGGQSHVIKLNLILLFPTSPPRRPPVRPNPALGSFPPSRASGAEDLDQVDQFLGFLPELTSDHSFYRIGNPS